MQKPHRFLLCVYDLLPLGEKKSKTTARVFLFVPPLRKTVHICSIGRVLSTSKHRGFFFRSFMYTLLQLGGHFHVEAWSRNPSVGVPFGAHGYFESLSYSNFVIFVSLPIRTTTLLLRSPPFSYCNKGRGGFLLGRVTYNITRAPSARGLLTHSWAQLRCTHGFVDTHSPLRFRVSL